MQLVFPVTVMGLAHPTQAQGDRSRLMDNFIPIILVTILFTPFAWMLTRRFAPIERDTILKIVFFALFVRMGVAFVFALFLPAGYFGEDAVMYMNAGMRLSAQWQDPSIQLAQYSFHNKSHMVYQYVCGGIYYVVGNITYAPAYFNALFGMISLLLLANLLQSVFAYRIVRNFLLLTCFFPSIILFHTYPLKDTLVFLFVTISLYNYMLYIQGRSAVYLGIASVILLPLYFLRFYLVIMLIAIYMLVIFFFAGEFSAKKIVRSLVAGLIIIVFSFFAGLGPKIVEVTEKEANVAQLNQYQTSMKSGRAATFQGQEYQTGFDVIRYFPMRLVMFMFAPFPWQITSAASAMAFMEMPIWWLLIPWWIRGAKIIFQQKHVRLLLPLLLYTFLVSALFAIVESNIGAMFRKRAQVLPFFLMLVVMGRALEQAKRLGLSPDIILTPGLRRPFLVVEKT